jgi:hypothetical protein
MSSYAPPAPATTLGSKLWGQWKAGSGAYTDAGTTLAANTQTVRQWNDQSGNGRHFSQATGANRPAYRTSIVNGKSVLRFDGAASFMSLAAAFAPTGSFSIIAVLATSSTADQMFLSGTGINRQVRLNESATGCLSLYEGTNAHRSAATTFPTNGTFGIAAWRGTVAAGCRIYKNAAEAYYAANPTPFAATLSVDVLGRFELTGGTLYSNLDLAELIFINGDLTRAEWRSLQEYLANEYAITIPAEVASVPEINFCQVTEANGAYFNLGYSRHPGVIGLGDWSIDPVEALALARSISIADAAAIYTSASGIPELSAFAPNDGLGFAAFKGYMMLDLEGASSLLDVYPAIIAAIRLKVPGARLLVWLGAPSFLANAAEKSWVSAADGVLMECYQAAVETTAEASAAAYQVVQDTRGYLNSAGLSSKALIPNLALEVGHTYPGYVYPDGPLTTAADLAARHTAIRDTEVCEAIAYWVACTPSNTQRRSDINGVAAGLDALISTAGANPVSVLSRPLQRRAGLRTRQLSFGTSLPISS